MSPRMVIVAAVLLVSGCATGPTFESARKSGLIDANYAAADSLITLSRRPLSTSAPILVATLVSIEDLNQSSNLGRLVAEQVATRFTQRGYLVAEPKLRGSMLMLAQGQLLLSRDARSLAESQKAQAVIVGTYAVGGDYVYVTVKLIEAGAHNVISAYDYVLPLSGQIRALLERNSRS